MKKIIVTSALPYANGSIHIGHLAGAYLPADVYTRFQKLMGEDVIYICGTDEHGTPITFQAEIQNVNPKQITDRYHKEILDALTQAGIKFDYFSRTTTATHYKLTQEFFTELFENDYISTKEEENFYCEKSGQFLPDRYIEGECPYCGANARGDECPSCGRWLEVDKLKNPYSRMCEGELTKKLTKHWYLKLNALQPRIETWLNSREGWKTNVTHFIEGWFKEGLKERAITRDLSWGVPLPLNEEDAKNKVLYVWFDAPIGYISMTKEWGANIKKDPELWKKYWMDDQTQLVHFIGKDNIPFHAVVWPGMLLGQTTHYILPSDIPANEHLTINEEKISTSKGNCVWVSDVVDHLPSDYLRYYLCYIAPENKDADFSWQHFAHTINTELINVIGNLNQRVVSFITDFLKIEGKAQGSVPQLDESSLTDPQKALLELLPFKIKAIKDLFAKYKVKEAVKEIADLARKGNLLLQESEPWKTIKTNEKDTYNLFNILIRVLEVVGGLLMPIIPSSSKKMLQRVASPLSENKEGLKDYITPSNPAGRVVEKGEPLFERIEQKFVTQQEQKLKERIEALENETENKKEISPKKAFQEITIDDFGKISLKTGKILSVQRVAKSEKLLKFQLQSGGDVRQILSGIAAFYPNEQELVGKNIVFVENLKPVKLMGEISQGMILSAENKEKGTLEVVCVSENVGDGAYVK
jgi:methionyl-tRNA synthetase